MKGNRYSEDQIIGILKEIEGGASIASVCRAHGVSDKTVHRWREKYAGMTKSEVAELKRLQAENVRLGRLVTRLSLEKEAYREIAEGKW